MATDNLILSAKIEDEVAHLEIYVYEDEVDNLYVHHDIMLPDIPLCLEWLDFPVGNTASDPNQAGNFVAVGTMSPDIEIWNLDIVDSILPDAILGQGSSDPSDNTGSRPAPSKKKSSKKRKRISTTHHVDAVLALAANKQHRNLLASSSADTTIKLWDLPTQKCAQSYTYHGGKVSAIAWNPKDAPILLSGSYDHSVAVADVRAPNAEPLRAKTTSDVEGVLWDPHESNCFYVSSTVPEPLPCPDACCALLTESPRLRSPPSLAPSCTTTSAPSPPPHQRQNPSGHSKRTTSPSPPSTPHPRSPACSPPDPMTRK